MKIIGLAVVICRTSLPCGVVDRIDVVADMKK